MNKISKTRFKKIVLANKISFKSIEQIGLIDKFKMFVLKKPYLAVLSNLLSESFSNIDESRYFEIVNFFMVKGIIVPFDGDIGRYLIRVLEYLCKEYWIVDGDSKSEIDKKINILYGYYVDLMTNGDKYAESIIISKLVPIIKNIFN